MICQPIELLLFQQTMNWEKFACIC